MSTVHILQALRRERAELVVRWIGQFAVHRAAAGYAAVAVNELVVGALFDDLLDLLDPAADPERTAGPDRASALARLATFPDSVAVAIDLLQSGVQVLGAFVVENAGPWAAWTLRARNRFLGELDAVFPLLVRREVAALCEGFLPPPSRGTPAAGTDDAVSLPLWARAITLRN